MRPFLIFTFDVLNLILRLAEILLFLLNFNNHD